MSFSPVSSSLARIAELPSTEPGAKVRIYGCVTSYNSAISALTLKPAHPSTQTCTVDLTAVIPTLTSSLVTVGTWVNVIGYVSRDRTATVEAVSLWEAGPVSGVGSVRVWGGAVKARREAMAAMERAREEYAGRG